jgi:hypothetical protein
MLSLSGTPANKSFDASGAQYVWDATSLTLAQTCLRKYQYKMLEGWRGTSESFHLTFGKHYATALEHYYKHVALGATLDEALSLVVHEALIATWEYETEPSVEGDEGFPNAVNITRDTGAPWLSPDSAKTRENLIRSIIWYVEQFGREKISVIHLSDGRPAVELSFSFNVDNGYVLAGHLDRLVEYSNDVYVMDQKTTKSALAQNYFNGFNPDIQMSTYTFAGQAIFDLPVRGVIIDAAQIAVGFTRFERGFTFRTKSQLNEWYDETMGLIESTRRHTLDKYFPMNRTACGNYGGCEFRSICARSAEVRGNFLAADFVKGPSWDPLDRR